MFESLLPPPHDALVLDLLFLLALWQALAKLRLHSNSSLNLLDAATKELGKLLRKFKHWTSEDFIDTQELPREQAAQEAREARESARAAAVGVPESSSRCKGKQRTGAPRIRTFNLLTYKIHALGDYASTIRMFGTTDSYSTQIVSCVYILTNERPPIDLQGELEHWRVKQFYARTNKTNYTAQIATLERRTELLCKIRLRVDPPAPPPELRPQQSADSALDLLPPIDPSVHYHIAFGEENPIDVIQWVVLHKHDPATKVCTLVFDYSLGLLTCGSRTSCTH